MMRTCRNLMFAAAVLGAGAAQATHLVGGNLGYVYQGETAPGSQVYRYQVYMEFYMNCGPNSNFQSLYELLGNDYGQPLTVGCYIQDPLNPNANKQKQVDVQVFLTDSLVIEADLPNNCTIGQGLCTVKGTFVGTMDVPLNFGGYHLYYQMCCRNLDIDNLANPNGTGIGYYAFVPPPLVNNSSPVFLGIPTPFLCTSDTTTFLNTASDPDGDQLIFSFETPYNSVQFGGGIVPPPAQLPWPVPNVTYNPGFGVAQPFGAGGYSFINGATGLTEYVPPLQGNYVVSVEVREFRNGQLIGRTRRDLQLQAIPCPPNNTPNAIAGQPVNYTVNAGDLLCFDLDFSDIDGDSLTLTAAGLVFDPLVTNPPATIGAPVQGVGTVGTQFCWDTDCSQGQSQPYLFSVSVTDNGCPPKTIDAVISVTVVPFAGPTQVLGPLQVCAGQDGSAYTTPPIAGATFNWTVSGGTIAGGGTGNAITVDWGSAGTGTVNVSATNSLGCTSAPASATVNIVALPATDAGVDTTVCGGGTAQLGGSPTGPAGSSYTWTPSTGLSAGNVANPTSNPSTTTTYVVQVSNSGCVSTDTVTVSLALAQADAGAPASVCLGDTVQLSATGGDSYLWSPATGLSDPTVADPLAFPTVTTTYAVIVTDSLGCSTVDSVTVTVNQPPVVDAGADTLFCPGTTVTLGGSPTGPAGSQYIWTPSTGLSDAFVANPVATAADTITYIVAVLDTNGCAAADAVTLFELPVPNVDAGPDQTICAGDSAQLQGSGTGTLLWTPPFGISDPTIPDPFVSPEATIIYTLTATAPNTCVSSDQVTVTVNVLPSANAGPDKVICLGDSVIIGLPGPGTFAWTPAAGLSSTSVATPLASPATTTMYFVSVVDTNACAQVDSMMVTVNQPVNAGGDGADITCSTGLPIVLANLLTGTPDQGGTWVPTDLYIPGSGGGTFLYVVNGTAPCPNDTAVVTITESDSPDAGQGTTLELCSSDAPVDLFPLLGPTADTTGTWTLSDGTPFNGVFDPAVDPPGACTYLVTGAPPCFDAFAVVDVTVLTQQNPGIDDTVAVCGSGVSFTLTDSLGGTSVAGGAWFAPDGSAHGDVFDPAVDVNGVYTYVVAGGTACADSATVTVNVLNPTADAGPNTALCAGDTVQLNATGGATYAWSPAAGLSDAGIADPQAFPVVTTTYTVAVTDALGCVALDSVTVTVNPLPTADAGPDGTVCLTGIIPIGGSPTGPPNATYLWTPSAGLSNVNAANPDAQPVLTITYTVLVTDANQCTDTDTVTVTVNPPPALNAGPDTSVCLNSGVQLNATGNGQFLWSPAAGLNLNDVPDPIASPLNTTTYTVTLLDSNNCSSTDQLTVTVNGLPNADAGEDVWVCPGFDVQLTGSGGGTYSWSPAADVDDPASATPQASPASTTSFVLTVTDGNGCTDTDAVTVTVNDDPPIDAGADQTICVGQQVQLGGNPSGLPGSSFSWSPAAGLDDPTAPNPFASPSVSTAYTLTVTNDTCTSTQVVNVSLQGNADPAFSVRLEPNCDGLRAFFTDESTGATQWSWDFGDGGTSTVQDPQHEFAYDAAITVTLTITDAFGCTGDTTQTFASSSFPELTDMDVPNVFTPNGDGRNDLFSVGQQGGEVPEVVLGGCSKMLVYNRWGQKVFESLGANLAWDGRTMAGIPCEPGTYFYVLTVKELEFKGTVQLIR